MNIDPEREELLDRFWSEYNAYALRDFKKDGYYYDTHPLEDAVVRIVCEERNKAKEEVFNTIWKSKVDNLGNCGCWKIIEKIKENHLG